MDENREKKIKEKISGKEEKEGKKRGGGDEWFKKHYLDDMSSLETTPNKFGVSELDEEEIEKLPDTLRNYVPYACKRCRYSKEIPRWVFKIEVVPKNLEERRELKEYMEKEHDVKYFKIKRGIGTKTLNVGECPRCESQDVLFSYEPYRSAKKKK